MCNEDPGIDSVSQFIDRLSKAVKPDKEHVFYFRGHSKKSFKLEPLIYRNDGWIANEARMLKELIVRCPNDFEGMSTFQTLVKMQHYGLPTRLLDVTSNPLVALYFACEHHGKSDDDGEVIVACFDIEKEVKYYDSDTVSVIANLSRRPYDSIFPSTELSMTEFNDHGVIALLLHDIRQDRPCFLSKIIPSDIGRVLCVRPKLDNPRIIRQDGAFLLFGIGQNKRNAAKLDSKFVAAKIKINKNQKDALTKELETLGISREILFPELEQVASVIKERYKQNEKVIDTVKEKFGKECHS